MSTTYLRLVLRRSWVAGGCASAGRAEVNNVQKEDQMIDTAVRILEDTLASWKWDPPHTPLSSIYFPVGGIVCYLFGIVVLQVLLAQPCISFSLLCECVVVAELLGACEKFF